jgi:hypothetical protein
MSNLNYFRGSPGGTGVPAGWGQATNTGAVAGISKGMDALAKGLEKFFQNKKEQAEEDAYAELLEKLNEVPGKTKEDVSSRRTNEEVMSAAMQGTENLPAYLTNAAAQGHIEGVPFTGPMPVDPESIDPTQIMTSMSPNPAIEGMLYDPESGEYYPHLTDTMLNGEGTGQFLQSPDGNYIPASSAATEFPGEWMPPGAMPGAQNSKFSQRQWGEGMQPAPQMLPDIPPGVPMDRPMPDYRATEAVMAGQQVPLSFGEQDQARQQLIAEYTRRIGTDRAEKLMGEQFKTHRDAAGNPLAYSLGKTFQMAPKTDPAFTSKDFIPIMIGDIEGKFNVRDGKITLPSQENVISAAVSGDIRESDARRASLKAMKGIDPPIKFVTFNEDSRNWASAEEGDSGAVRIDEAIARETTKEPASTSRQRAADLLHNR